MWSARWRILIVSALIAFLVFARSNTIDELYAAEAKLSVTPGASSAGQVVPLQDSLFLARTYAEQATTVPVVRAALEQSELELSVDEATDALSAEAATDVGFITITATAPSPELAELLAESTALALVEAIDAQQEANIALLLEPVNEQIAAIEEQLGAMAADDPNRESLEARLGPLQTAAAERQLRSQDRVVLVSPARADDSPVVPTPLRDAILAFIIALIVNAELAVLISVLGDRFSRNFLDEIPRLTGLPILAEIPRGESDDTVEAFRTLRTNLRFLKAEDGLRTLAIVGVDAGCGKSYVAAHIARSSAHLDVPVLLIDADLRRPVLHEVFGVRVVPGFTDVRNRNDLIRVTASVSGEPNLRFMPAGSSTSDPVALLGDLGETLDALTEFDLIVIDTPTSALFADAIAIAAQCDASLVVVDAQTAKRRSVVNLVDSLRQVGANPVGVVVNRTENRPGASTYRRFETVS